MKYRITAITDTSVILVDENEHEFIEDKLMYDTLMISTGYTFEAEDVLPYSISSARRQDIRDYRADEARNGNIWWYMFRLYLVYF